MVLVPSAPPVTVTVSLRISPCSQSYLQVASDGPAGHSLEPSANYDSPKFRSRNQSYLRAVSMLSQASCVSQVGPLRPGPSLHSHVARETGPQVCGSQEQTCNCLSLISHLGTSTFTIVMFTSLACE